MKYKILIIEGETNCYSANVYANHEECCIACEDLKEYSGVDTEIVEFCDCMGAGCNYCLML